MWRLWNLLQIWFKLVVVRIFNATRHLRHIQRQLLCTCICTSLFSWITYVHLVPLSVTVYRPVHFLLNTGHVEYQIGVLTVWKLSRAERESNPRYSAWKSSALITRPHSTPSPLPHPPIRLKVVVVWILNATRHLRHIVSGNCYVYVFVQPCFHGSSMHTWWRCLSPSTALSILYSTQGTSSMS